MKVRYGGDSVYRAKEKQARRKDEKELKHWHNIWIMPGMTTTRLDQRACKSYIQIFTCTPDRP
jgi:hypothetical protein